MMYCHRRRNKRCSIESCGEVSQVKGPPDFMAGFWYTSTDPHSWCSRPGARLEESLRHRGWGFGRADTPPRSLKLSPSPVFLVWSCGGRKNVSLLIVMAQAFSSSSVKNHWNALNNKLPKILFFPFFNLSDGRCALLLTFPHVKRNEILWSDLSSGAMENALHGSLCVF